MVDDRLMHGKSPMRDPAQKRLIEAEVQEQQNPYKTPPSNLTSIDKAVDAGSRPARLHMTEPLQGATDSFEV